MEKEKMIKTFKEMDFNILCYLNEAVDEYVENLEKYNYGIDKELIVLNEVLCDSAMQRAKELINAEKELKEILSDNENYSEATFDKDGVTIKNNNFSILDKNGNIIALLI